MKFIHLTKITFIGCFLLFFFSANGQSRITKFDVKKHGFAFANHFKSHVGDAGSVKITTSGLCGGMSFAANDYFQYGKTTPKQKHKPNTGSPLHKYIFDRQINSFASLDKYVEYTVNPFGWRDEEFFYWGLEGRLRTLRSKIDRGTPAPLGLCNYHNSPSGHHQVLAIGYDLGGYKYKRDKDSNKNNVKIFIYDPNYPGEVHAIKANSNKTCFEQYRCRKSGNKYIIIGKPIKKWRSYFVDKNYKKKRPNVSNYTTQNSDPNKIHTVVFELTTGDDDLRGGNDNVDLFIVFKNGKKKAVYCANRKKRWVDNYTENVSIRLDRPIDRRDIARFEIVGTMSGGMGGDNWNLQRAKVVGITGSNRQITLCTKSGKPLKRFTGDSKRYSFM